MKLLVLRFSALGDVAMTVPVLRAFAAANPEVQITVASKSFHAPLFEGFGFRGFDLKDKRYGGMFGIANLIADLDLRQYDAVADLHDVLRTKAIRVAARLRGMPVAHIDKNRSGRKALTRKDNKVLVQQKTSFEKYSDVLVALGLKAPLAYPSGGGEAVRNGIGIAPFATHKGKIYPIEKMERVVRILSEEGEQIWLFGGGAGEMEVMRQWAGKYPNVQLARDCCKGLKEELSLMARLEAMLSMDSANMHLASLAGTRVVSVWGGTHPLAGFMGWGQSTDDAIQLDMPCRPCSIFGNKPCLRGDYACLEGIAPETIVSKLRSHKK